VEYENGDVELFKEEGMFHIAREDFPRGATKPEQHFVSHDIRWIDPKSPFAEASHEQDNSA